MIDIYRKDYQPALDEIGEFVNNPVFLQFCGELGCRYHASPKIEFSSCSCTARRRPETGRNG